MPAHPEFVSAFDAALRGGALPPGLTAPDQAEVARRFAVYRNNVAVSLSAALAARFPVIARLVGQEFFAALARLYAIADRPRSPVLQDWGDGFAAFLAEFPPLAAYPYMPDVARIEYARGRAFHAADGTPVDPAIFAAADPEALCLRLHPSVIVLQLAHPAVSIWQANQPGASPAGPVAPAPEIALILRDRQFAVPVTTISPAEAAFLQGLGAGEPLAAAARNAALYEPTSILLRLSRAGTFLATEPS